jgi:hypothetical protein
MQRHAISKRIDKGTEEINMAIRYAGIEFDTVEELIAYKELEQRKRGQQKVEKPISYGAIPQYQPQPEKQKTIVVMQRKRRKSPIKITDDLILNFLQNRTQKLNFREIAERMGVSWCGSFNNKVKRVMNEHKLWDKLRTGKKSKSKGFKNDKISAKRSAPFTETEQIRLEKMYQEGKTNADIARELGMEENRVFHRIHNSLLSQKYPLVNREIIPPHPKRKSNSLFSDKEIAIIQEMRARGERGNAIAKVLGCNPQKVYNKIYVLGLDKNKHSPPMQNRRPFVPFTYTEAVTKMADKQTKPNEYNSFPDICDNNGMCRIVTKDLINHHISSINLSDHAELFGIDCREWDTFVGRYIWNAIHIAKHFEVENKFKIEGNDKIVYG